MSSWTLERINAWKRELVNAWVSELLNMWKWECEPLKPCVPHLLSFTNKLDTASIADFPSSDIVFYVANLLKFNPIINNRILLLLLLMHSIILQHWLNQEGKKLDHGN